MSIGPTNPKLQAFFMTMYLFTSKNLTFEPDELAIKNDFGDNPPEIYWGMSELAYRMTAYYAPNSPMDASQDLESPAIKIQASTLPGAHQAVFRLMSSIILEAYSLDYVLNVDADEIQYISSDEIQKIMNNCDVVCDWLGEHTQYLEYLPLFRDYYTILGYLRNQVSYILNSDESLTFRHLMEY